jgi:hypothetical protein
MKLDGGREITHRQTSIFSHSAIGGDSFMQQNHSLELLLENL